MFTRYVATGTPILSLHIMDRFNNAESSSQRLRELFIVQTISNVFLLIVTLVVTFQCVRKPESSHWRCWRAHRYQYIYVLFMTHTKTHANQIRQFHTNFSSTKITFCLFLSISSLNTTTPSPSLPFLSLSIWWWLISCMYSIF